MIGWAVRVSTPLPEDRMLTLRTLDATQVEIEWGLSGVESIRVGGAYLATTAEGDQVWTSAYLPEPLDSYRDLCHVGLYCGEELVADGQADEPVESTLGEVVGVNAVGYALHLQDATIQSTDTTSYRRDDLVRRVVRAYCPLLSLLEPLPPLTESLTLGDCDGLKPGDVLDQISRQGDGQGNAVLYRVRPGRVLELVVSEQPEAPDYDWPAGLVPHQPPRQSAANIVTHAAISYTLPGASSASRYPTSDWTANPWVAASFPRRREYLIPGGVMTEAGAKLALLTYLKAHAERAVSYELPLPLERPVWGKAGLVPAWQVQPGQWARVGGRGPWLISRTRLSLAEGVVSVRLGTLETDIERFNGLFVNDQNRTRRVNVTTGGREA